MPTMTKASLFHHRCRQWSGILLFLFLRLQCYHCFRLQPSSSSSRIHQSWTTLSYRGDAVASSAAASAAASSSDAHLHYRRHDIINSQYYYRGRSSRTTSALKMQTNPTFTSSSNKIIATSPALGGDIIRIRTGPDDDDAGFLTSVGVPTFAVVASEDSTTTSTTKATIPAAGATSAAANGSLASETIKPKRLGLEAILGNPNAFYLQNALSSSSCESILNVCEHQLGFGNFDAGKNNHGAMQVVISKTIADELLRVIGPHVDLNAVVDAEKELLSSSSSSQHGKEETAEDDGNNTRKKKKQSFALRGINRRFRIYRYAPNKHERFAPHIDAGFPPGGVSFDDDDDPVDKNDEYNNKEDNTATPYLHWDASHQYPTTSEMVSRLTVLIYLNDDFRGGHTKFYEPLCERDHDDSAHGGDDGAVIASVKPRAGSILVFPQAISEAAVERARWLWPLHEGSPVTSGTRPKYVIRTDVLFETIVEEEEALPEHEKVLFQHDDAVRNVFLNTSPVLSETFLRHVEPLYNPHMGVENAGPLLYSLVRFAKCRNVVEVGAGYTTLFLLQALKDNDEEMQRVVNLDMEGQLRLLDYPFGTPRLSEWSGSTTNPSSSLLCIDNCEHQRETASGAVGVARTLGLDSYLQFLKGDAFDALDTHFSSVESIDLLWCDFGVGSRMKEYASNVWKYVAPGGFLVCHSTLTNQRTREWLEAVRHRKGVEETGIPDEEYAELSLLEPHKRFQNSMTILQKRVGFSEPLYSEYA